MKLKMDEYGIYLTLRFANGRLADVMALTGGRARIGLCAAQNRWVYDHAW